MTAVPATRSALLGAAAALVAPWHLEGRRLRRLLDGPTGAGGGPGPAADGIEPAAALAPGAAAAVRSSNRLLRALARLPATPWRNTCLYRAAAGCLALRWLGRPARLCIGTRRDATTGEIVAHAWIEDPTGRIGVGYDGDYRVLSGRERAAS